MEDQYRKHGKKYGYKDCCINSFIQEEFRNYNCGMFQGTKKEGFIPCNECYDNLLTIYENEYKSHMKYGSWCIKKAWNIYILL